MNWLLPCMILASTQPAPMDDGYAETVFACDFEPEHDRNFDGWPDAWTRRRGRDFPLYLPIEIVEDFSHPRPEGPHALRIKLDGGAAIVYSPPIPVNSLFSYALEAYTRTEGLENNVAFVAITFLDEKGNELETHRSPELTSAESWQPLRVGPFVPSHPETRRAVLSLHLRTRGRPDLRGSAWFDDVWFARLPRLAVEANAVNHLYEQADNIEIRCQVSGTGQTPPGLTVALLDAQGRELAHEELQLEGEAVRFAGEGVGDEQVGFAGVATWHPPIAEQGFYRVHVSMRGPSGRKLERAINLAVLAPFPKRTDGEFGWSLPRGEQPYGVQSLAYLLPKMGVHWVKLPVWFHDQDTAQADRLAWFAERLGTEGLELIGVLDLPPRETRSQFAESDRISIASVFLDAQLWRPILDPVMVRLSLKVRWWQLGADTDASFISYPGLVEKINSIKRHFDQFGQKTRLALNWQWLYATPEIAAPPWATLSQMEEIPFTPAELAEYLGKDASADAARWVMLQPLERNKYTTEARARDLVLRMAVAKIAGAEGIFATDPFAAETGLLTPDGKPAELLLPWRTTASLIAGAKYQGRLRLPNQSHNYVFARDGQAIIVVWSDRVTQERMYFGEDVEQIDIWGRRVRPAEDTDEQGWRRQVIATGPLPTFIVGAHLGIAEWRMNFQFDRDQLSSVFGREQVASYRFANSFRQGVGGVLRLNLPEVWDSSRRDVHFKLSSGEQHEEIFRVVLGTDASSGPQPVRIDFDITADRRYRFSVYRTIEVGLGDVVVELNTRLDSDGNLVVEQQLVNRTDQFVSFNCLLFPPHRRRERRQIINLGQGRTVITYTLPDGEELLGQKIWLRAEEIGGNRLLNYHVVAER